MTAPKMPDYAGHWWNVGYLEGEQERVALAVHNDELRHEAEQSAGEVLRLLAENVRLYRIVSRVSRYVLAGGNATEVAARGVTLLGKAWVDIVCGPPTLNDKDAR